MQTRKTVMLSAGVIAIVSLFAATNAFAQAQCESRALTKQGTEVAGNFVVTVVEQTLNGRRIYRYSVSSPTGAHANKLFIWVRQGIVNEEGFSTRRVDTNQPGTYVTPHQTAGDFPPDEAWQVAHHEDGVVWTNIATNNQFEINVKERFKPGESLTTVLIGIGNTFEHCGPIPGPKNPATPSFNTVFASSETHLCFKNGCCYFATTEETTGQVTSLVPDPVTPFETIGCGGTGEPTCQACQVEISDCAADLGIPDCGRVVITAPLQSQDGGTCYYPTNIKFTC